MSSAVRTRKNERELTYTCICLQLLLLQPSRRRQLLKVMATRWHLMAGDAALSLHIPFNTMCLIFSLLIKIKYYLQLRQFRRLDRVAVETDEIEDVPVRSPERQVSNRPRRPIFDLKRALWVSRLRRRLEKRQQKGKTQLILSHSTFFQQR